MEKSDVFDGFTGVLDKFAEGLANFFGSNPFLYGFLLIVVFIYGSQYVPVLPKQLNPILNNPIAHFLYFYLVCVLLQPKLAGQGALIAFLLTIVINLISTERVATVVKSVSEPVKEPVDKRMYGYETEEEAVASVEAERSAIEEEYTRQMSNGNGSSTHVNNGVPTPAENGGYAPVGY
jgi:hypothetical protein